MSPKTRGFVYREAARLLEKEPSVSLFGCCGAVCRSLGLKSHQVETCRPLHDELAQHFRTEDARSSYWMGEFTEENRDARILALCFMAAMVEAGDA